MKSAQDKIAAVLTEISNQNSVSTTTTAAATVGLIISMAQLLFPAVVDKEFWAIVQGCYIEIAMTYRGVDYNSARQSWVTASGGNFEGHIRLHINQVLNLKGIAAIKGDRLRQLGKRSENVQRLITFLTLPAKRRCTQSSLGVWPDNDVLVLTLKQDGQWRIIASVSAKTSSHSRNTSVLFWSLAVRDLGIKYYLATLDRDDQFVKPCASTAVNQERKLFEAYCDRVFTANPLGSYCSQVKPLVFTDSAPSALTDELLDIKTRDVSDAVDTPVSVDDLESY
jgi:hypothetical protein